MSTISLDNQADHALSRLQDTTLNPMEEALFKAWTKANQIKDPDVPGDAIDYRGIFKATNGQVLPAGELKNFTERISQETKLHKVLHEQMMKRIGTAQDKKDQLHSEERQDITHGQKMEMEQLKLQRAPHDLKMREHDVKAKEMDLHKQRLGLDAQKLGNEGKQLDIVSSLVNPQPMGAPSAARDTTKAPTK